MPPKFYTRTITGAVFVFVLNVAILFNPISFYLLFGIITFAGLIEFYNLIGDSRINPNKLVGVSGGIVCYFSACFVSAGFIGNEVFLVLIPITTIIFVIEIYRKKDNPFLNIAITILGIAYIAIPFSLLVLIGFKTHDLNAYMPHIILGLFVLIWSSDTGAYLTGITIGKHPLLPRVSPKKSWEGLFGGVIFTLIVAFVLSHYFKDQSLTDWLVFALIISLFGVWGDLAESLLKRSYNIKDSGNILPGHGGILDRFDSAIFSIPIVFLYLQTKFLFFH